MEQYGVVWQNSPGWLPVCLLAGAAYAWLLYQAGGPWGPVWNRVLAFVRGALVTLLALLLLNPLLRQVSSLLEKPVVVLAIDNSLSVEATTPGEQLKTLPASLKKVQEQLESQGMEVAWQNLEGPLASADSLRYSASQTNLSALMGALRQSYEGRNLAAVALVSDGIFNQGISPAYSPYTFPVYTVGLGDTIPRTDLNLRTVLANQVAYKGNKYPIRAEIAQSGFTGKSVPIRLLENGKEVQSKLVTFSGSLASIEFVVEAAGEGTQHWEVVVAVQPGEFTPKNNSRHMYVEIIEAREKILIAAAAPHPDLKALRAALGKEQNYEISVHIPGLDEWKEQKYDLVIFHNLPDNTAASLNLVKKVQTERTAHWFIVGSLTNLAYYNNSNPPAKILLRASTADKVGPVFNAGFARFSLEGDKQNLLKQLPPLAVPFGDYQLASGAETILYQRVGSLSTEKPLLVLAQNEGYKTGLLAGEGLWQWRLQEYQETGAQAATDELIRKMAQLLSAKEDKRKFRVTPLQTELSETERVVLETEAYNSLYEPVYNVAVDLKLRSEKGQTRSFSYTHTEANPRFDLGRLPHGAWQFTATTTLNGQQEKAEGRFVVREAQYELMNLTADHGLLRQLASQTGGAFFPGSQIEKLAEALQANPPKERVSSFEDLSEAIEWKGLFFIILALLTLEWGIRKAKGLY